MSQVTGVSAETTTEGTHTTPVLRRRNTIETWVFLIPAIVFQLSWGWYPLIMGVVLSFVDGQTFGDPTFVGFSNYTRMLSDPLVKDSMINTFLYSSMGTILTFFPPIIAAIFIMEMPRKITYLMMFLWFLPLSGITNIALWRYFYDPNYGLLQQFAMNVLHLPRQGFLEDPNQVLFWLIFPSFLLYGPNLLYMATLQGIPNSYFEAAEVEGASFWRKIWTITIPRLRPIIFLSLLLAIVGSLQPFDVPRLLGNNGQPEGRSRVVLMYVYNLTEALHISDGAALSCIVFVLTMAMVILFRAVFKDDPDA